MKPALHVANAMQVPSRETCELRKWWPALRSFARMDGVEPTINAAERALRPAVLWRKGSFGSDSELGSRCAERLLTVVATCRQQGRSLLDFRVAVGEAALQGTAAPSLLPARLGSVNAYRQGTSGGYRGSVSPPDGLYVLGIERRRRRDPHQTASCGVRVFDRGRLANRPSGRA